MVQFFLLFIHSSLTPQFSFLVEGWGLAFCPWLCWAGARLALTLPGSPLGPSAPRAVSYPSSRSLCGSGLTGGGLATSPWCRVGLASFWWAWSVCWAFALFLFLFFLVVPLWRFFNSFFPLRLSIL